MNEIHRHNNETFHNCMWHYTRRPAGTCLVFIIKVVTTSLEFAMESLIPPHKLPYKEDSFENSPATILITIDNASPSRQLLPTSIPLPPSPITLKPMDTYECFCLAENSDDISEILDLLEPNELLLCTWSYFQHHQQTAQKLEKEAWFQKDLAKSLLGDLRTLKIDKDTVTNYRQGKTRRTKINMICSTSIIHMHHYSESPTDTSIIRPDNPIPDTSLSTFAGGSISPLSHVGGPSRPIVIVDDDTTPPPSNALSWSWSSWSSVSRKRKGLPIRRPMSHYVRCMTTGLPNLGSFI